jgi:AcrR family transcriptional regulator
MTATGDADTFREAIIGASLELGQAYGEDGVTMRAIASKLGTSATTLYTCFESKAAIMRELRLRGVLSLGKSLLEALDIPGPRACLMEVSRRYVAFGRDNPWLYTLLFVDETPTAEVVTAAQSERLQALERELTGRFMERFMELGGLRPLDSRRVVVRWWAGVHGVASLLITRRVKSDQLYLPVGDVEAFVEDYLGGVVDGLAPPVD